MWSDNCPTREGERDWACQPGLPHMPPRVGLELPIVGPLNKGPEDNAACRQRTY
jgi:hypothetical protein